LDKEEFKMRFLLGMTQPQLAVAVGVDVMTVSRWECGVRSIPSYLESALRGLNKKAETRRDNKERKPQGVRSRLSGSDSDGTVSGELAPLRLRALRVTVIRDDGNGWKFIVFEDVDAHRFQVSSSSGGAKPRKGEKAMLDRLDAWDVLRSLREMGRRPEGARSYWEADSLDVLVSEEAEQMWKMFDKTDKLRKTSEEQPDERAPKTGRVPAKSPKPMIVAMPSDAALPRAGLSPEEIKKMFEAQMQMVWDYAGGNPWKWKSKRPTPAGRKCDVLTFSGSEMVTPGPTTIKIPKKAR
jgi:hypothetical protein